MKNQMNKKYIERQTILNSQSNLIQGYYDFIHTPPATLNKLLKKKHEERVLTVRNLMHKHYGNGNGNSNKKTKKRKINS
jgi:hypothetical protein